VLSNRTANTSTIIGGSIGSEPKLYRGQWRSFAVSHSFFNHAALAKRYLFPENYLKINSTQITFLYIMSISIFYSTFSNLCEICHLDIMKILWYIFPSINVLLFKYSIYYGTEGAPLTLSDVHRFVSINKWSDCIFKIFLVFIRRWDIQTDIWLLFRKFAYRMHDARCSVGKINFVLWNLTVISWCIISLSSNKTAGTKRAFLTKVSIFVAWKLDGNRGMDTIKRKGFLEEYVQKCFR
jgi:hypothetical protein